MYCSCAGKVQFIDIWPVATLTTFVYPVSFSLSRPPPAGPPQLQCPLPHPCTAVHPFPGLASQMKMTWYQRPPTAPWSSAWLPALRERRSFPWKSVPEREKRWRQKSPAKLKTSERKEEGKDEVQSRGRVESLKKCSVHTTLIVLSVLASGWKSYTCFSTRSSQTAFQALGVSLGTFLTVSI